MAKGYQIEKHPVVIDLPLIGAVELPTWLTYEPVYRSRKNTCYTLKAVMKKLRDKRDRRAAKRRKSLIELLRRSDIHPQNPYKL
jgi:hypothetical protein